MIFDAPSSRPPLVFRVSSISHTATNTGPDKNIKIDIMFDTEIVMNQFTDLDHWPNPGIENVVFPQELEKKMKIDIGSLLRQKLIYINFREQQQRIPQKMAQSASLEVNQQQPSNQGANEPNILISNQLNQANQKNPPNQLDQPNNQLIQNVAIQPLANGDNVIHKNQPSSNVDPLQNNQTNSRPAQINPPVNFQPNRNRPNPFLDHLLPENANQNSQPGNLPIIANQQPNTSINQGPRFFNQLFGRGNNQAHNNNQALSNNQVQSNKQAQNNDQASFANNHTFRRVPQQANNSNNSQMNIFVQNNNNPQNNYMFAQNNNKNQHLNSQGNNKAMNIFAQNQRISSQDDPPRNNVGSYSRNYSNQYDNRNNQQNNIYGQNSVYGQNNIYGRNNDRSDNRNIQPNNIFVQKNNQREGLGNNNNNQQQQQNLGGMNIFGNNQNNQMQNQPFSLVNNRAPLQFLGIQTQKSILGQPQQNKRNNPPIHGLNRGNKRNQKERI